MRSIDSSRQRFGLEFVGLARRWRQALDKGLSGAGFTDATWAPLVHLDEAGDGISQKDLAAAVGLDDSSLVRLIDILARRGLVVRRIDAADRRARRIHLTEEGRATVKRIRPVLQRIDDAMLQDLTDAEVAALFAAFRKIDQGIRRQRERAE